MGFLYCFMGNLITIFHLVLAKLVIVARVLERHLQLRGSSIFFGEITAANIYLA
jgi:hypothetical protein